MHSDSEAVVGTINGDYNIPLVNDGKNHDREEYLLLRCIAREFDRFVGVWKHRELNFLADDLLRHDEEFDGYSFAKGALERWAEKLSGAVSFKIYQTAKANAVIDLFKNQLYSHKVVKTYFVEVEMDRKYDIFLQIKRTLCPGEITLFIDKFEEKSSDFQNKVRDIVGENASPTKINGSTVLSFEDHCQENEKKLCIVFDASVLNHLDIGNELFTVVIAAPSEMKIVKQKKIMELNALSYIYFNGVEHTVIQENAENARLLRERTKRAIICQLLKNTRNN